MDKHELVVIGGGPGGYPAAIRAAQLGLDVLLVEKDRLGGECTNYGCIPTKALLKPLEHVYTASRYPFASVEYNLDFAAHLSWARGIAVEARRGIEYLLKGYGVNIVKAEARLSGEGQILLSNGDVVRADKVIVATGTSPKFLPGVRIDGRLVHDNRTILTLNNKPGSILIVGGGYIGVEYATIMALHGVTVYLVEMEKRLLPGLDKDLARAAARSLKTLGVKVFLGSKIDSLEASGDHVTAVLSDGRTLEADISLMAIGRKPNTRGLGLEEAGVAIDGSGYIMVNERMQTSRPDVLAAGDVTGPPLLAHKAFHQAVTAAENAGGLRSTYDPGAVPAVVYSMPELATVGLTLDEALKAGLKAASKRFPLAGLSMSKIQLEKHGFVKIVYELDTHRILGAQMAGREVGEIVGVLSLAIQRMMKLEDLSETVFPHPSIVEAVGEAVKLSLGKPLHYLLRLQKPT